MAVYFVVSVTVSDLADKAMYEQYILQVQPIVEHYGGEYIIRSNAVTHVSGAWQPDRLIVIKFPSQEALRACFSSCEYKKIEQLRVASVDASALIVEEALFNAE